jgi:lipid-A-disaccharide synthase
MLRKRIMLIAGEPSGDSLAAELVTELRARLAEHACETEFFGAGGPRMKAAGVDLAFDLTAHAVVGLVEVLRNLRNFRALFNTLLHIAAKRRPDVVICVDFSGFNRRFALALRRVTHRVPGWSPKIIQYVSPQAWASREGRVYQMPHAYDLLLAIFPFEPAWYSQRVPDFKVQFVGHPVLDRYDSWRDGIAARPVAAKTPARVLLLPGSRVAELKRHLPVILEAARHINAAHPAHFEMVLPTDELRARAQTLLPESPVVVVQSHGLPEALLQADLAIASTGTVTMECAFFKVPTVALYKTSWSTYQIAKRIVKVKYLAMPNLLAGEAVFPEFVQDQANPDNLAREALSLLRDGRRREGIRGKLDKIIDSLGEPGGNKRAAEAVADLILNASS